MILLESILVGVWTVLLYLIVHPQGYTMWFVLGFCKHGLAGLLGLHDVYCRLKGATRSNHHALLLESMVEGGVFALAYFLIPNHWISAFLLGGTLHLLFEVTGIHATFIKTKCIK